jgi:hypothetical protein
MRNDALAAWRSDPILERGGVWVDVPETEGVRFRLVRFGGANLDAASKFLEMQSEAESNGALETDQDQIALTARFVAHVLVVDWEGMGEDYDRARCQQLLMEAPDLIQWVQGACTDRATFRNAGRPRAVAAVSEVDPGTGSQPAGDQGSDPVGVADAG